MVQGSGTEQAPGVGQAPGSPGAILVSQVSPASTEPLLQVGEQSGSLSWVAPAGQQPSFAIGVVTGVCVQTRPQPLVPLLLSIVQGMPSLQSGGGQAPGAPGRMAVSQVSPGSIRPLPQPPGAEPPSVALPAPPSTLQAVPPQLRFTG